MPRLDRGNAGVDLYYYRARYYDPKHGRFLETDPVLYQDQMNLYTYVGNDPLNATDPSGESMIDPRFKQKMLAAIGKAYNDSMVRNYEASAARISHMGGVMGHQDGAYVMGAEANPMVINQDMVPLAEKLTANLLATPVGKLTVPTSSSVGRFGAQRLASRGLPVPSGLPKNINIGAQGKHIIGNNNYIHGRSPLASNVNPQKLLNGVHAGKYPITRMAGNKPVVNFGKTIGHVNGKETNYGIIHSGKNGSHIVPANPIQR